MFMSGCHGFFRVTEYLSEMSVKSKHSSKKGSVGKKEKRNRVEDDDEDLESSEEELDLTKECHPIGYYLSDRAEMINQMFSVIKGNKLKAMLPPILKDCDIEQLKLQCLDQLLGMSEKRITCILEGETLETSSESEVAESDEGDSDEKNGTSSGSSSERSDDSHGHESHGNCVSRKSKKRKGDSSDGGRVGKLAKPESDPPEQGKTLLEILELEMRARAIRALLKQSGSEKENEQGTPEPKAEVNGGGKELSGEVVDLTECEDEELPTCVKKERVEEDVDARVSNFEEKVEKSKTDKPNVQEDKKSKRLQAELELRNKLFKKKIYRTRQQRMENEEEERNTDKREGSNLNECSDIVIKEEPVEPEEVVVEDPEEGEISTSEDEYPVEVKQEPPDPTDPPEPLEGLEPQGPEEEAVEEDFERKIDEDAERITAIDNGTFVRCGNVDDTGQADGGMGKTEESEKCVPAERENQAGERESGRVEPEPEVNLEETSWRDRWLQKGDVQKLVKSSKIYAKVKKRIAEKSQRTKEEAPSSSEGNSDTTGSNSRVEMIEGSIEEYERLLGRRHAEKEGNSNKNENLQGPCFDRDAEKSGDCETSQGT